MNRNPYMIQIALRLISFFRSQTQQKRKGEDEVWALITGRIEAERRMRRRRISYRLGAGIAIAATLVGVIYLAIYPVGNSSVPLERYVNMLGDYQENGSQIQLLLGEDEAYAVTQGKEKIYYSSQGAISVGMDKQNVENAVADSDNDFNQLIVPKGKNCQVELSDGTMMYVNSGSRVVYPRVFGGRSREIYVEGEAYLEVAHDESKPFLVRTDRFSVEVLGTKFDICAYKDEERGNVALVSGAVRLNDAHQREVLLKPGHLVNIESGMASDPVNVNISDYISWIDGTLTVKDETLENTFRKIRRFYTTPIV